MGINRESDVAANLQIGPTDVGTVRIYVEADGVELPLDFEPDEADEIAEELRRRRPGAQDFRTEKQAVPVVGHRSCSSSVACRQRLGHFQPEFDWCPCGRPAAALPDHEELLVGRAQSRRTAGGARNASTHVAPGGTARRTPEMA